MKRLGRFFTIIIFFTFYQVAYSQTTYPGYQGRTEGVDWNRVSRNANDAINQANQNREARKAELDRNTEDNINLVRGKNVVTTHEAVDDLVTTFQYVVINELQNYNAMLKNGLIDPDNFSSMNFNCVTQYNYAIDYCNSINYKLNLLDPNSQTYKNADNSILAYLRNSQVNFNTSFQDTRKYKRVISQSFFITVKDDAGSFKHPTLDWFFNDIKGLIK